MKNYIKVIQFKRSLIIIINLHVDLLTKHWLIKPRKLFIGVLLYQWLVRSEHTWLLGGSRRHTSLRAEVGEQGGLQELDADLFLKKINRAIGQIWQGIILFLSKSNCFCSSFFSFCFFTKSIEIIYYWK